MTEAMDMITIDVLKNIRWNISNVLKRKEVEKAEALITILTVSSHWLIANLRWL